MKHSIKVGFAPLVALAAAVSLTFTPAALRADDAKEQLQLKLPEATLKGTPEDLPQGVNIEKAYDAPQVFLAPKGVKNIALDKTVTSSTKPYTGDLKQIVDGKKEAIDDDSVEFKKGVQWVQVDLGASQPIAAIALWHDHRYVQVMHCVIVQVSDDAEFKTGVTTLFNNDAENIAGQGAGKDREYFETRFGKIIDGKGTKGRYVRGYTKGSTSGALNAWQELEVYAVPAK